MYSLPDFRPQCGDKSIAVPLAPVAAAAGAWPRRFPDSRRGQGSNEATDYTILIQYGLILGLSI